MVSTEDGLISSRVLDKSGSGGRYRLHGGDKGRQFASLDRAMPCRSTERSEIWSRFAGKFLVGTKPSGLLQINHLLSLLVCIDRPRVSSASRQSPAGVITAQTMRRPHGCPGFELALGQAASLWLFYKVHCIRLILGRNAPFFRGPFHAGPCAVAQFPPILGDT